MFENVRLEITAEHIEKGVPEDCQACPLALALKAAIPMATAIDVGPEICFHFDGRVYLGEDDAVEDWRASYDDGDELGPATFEMSFEDIGSVEEVEESFDDPCSLPIIEGGKV